ncbi:zeta toxin family protein [Romeria aff. gracilis LEGE 07310]|uniref:UDP-N-acetylglucosamine kinase n=1 Tax=Vasconcelosia minhoensis LEGE 07310 TaxID=915328 RepID=A0A8J7DDR9_9CYAN|nr:zeta toxin family protein [Romeria gracilis]MBE9080167.1 zeta toxin family protein [Romeria aff. gracilis LEGE 07310]
MTSPPPSCWIIAGPNGAGKTTFALQYLPSVANCRNFVNADLIAAGLSPLAPEAGLIAASRLFLREIENRIQVRQDFAFETTLAGRSYLRLIKRLRAEGWRVELIYLALLNVETSRLRVAERVAHGGHSIPLSDIERRFPRSLRNLLNEFSFAVDRTQCYLNDSDSPLLIFTQQGEAREILRPELFNQLIQQAER